MCYIVSMVDEQELLYKEAHVGATTPCYFAANSLMIEGMLRTPLSFVPEDIFSILL